MEDKEFLRICMEGRHVRHVTLAAIVDFKSHYILRGCRRGRMGHARVVKIGGVNSHEILCEFMRIESGSKK